MRRPPPREVVEKMAAWKDAYERGVAGALCDEIVRRRDPPAALLVRLSCEPAPRKLSRREAEVVYLISMGWPRENISSALGVGVETVKTHLLRAKHKLDALNRTHMVATALRSFEIV